MRIGETLGWRTLELDKQKIVELQLMAEPNQASYENILDGLQAMVKEALGYIPTGLIGKDNVVMWPDRDSVEFVGIPSWRVSDFVRAPSRAVESYPVSEVDFLKEGKHVFGDGIVGLFPPNQNLAMSPNGWAQVRIFARDEKKIYRAWKGVILLHPNIKAPLMDFNAGYGVNIPAHAKLEVHVILQQAAFTAEHTIQGLYYQGVPGWWEHARISFRFPPEKAKLAETAPVDLLYPLVQYADVAFGPQGYGGILVSPKVLPFIGLSMPAKGEVLAYTRRYEGRKVIFNRRPDLPTGQSAVELLCAGLSPFADAIIAHEEDIAVTGADYDGDIGYLFPTPEHGGLYMPFRGKGLERKTLATKDYPDGLHRWAGQVHAARILGQVEVRVRRAMDLAHARGERVPYEVLEAATEMIQVAVDRQKRDIAWPPMPELEAAEEPTLTDFFRVALPGGKVSPEGNTATAKVFNRWRTWQSLRSFTGALEVRSFLQEKIAPVVGAIVSLAERRKPGPVLARLAFALPDPAPRDKEIDDLLKVALTNRELRYKIYDSLVDRVTASQVTDHPELWLRVATKEELQAVFGPMGLTPAMEELDALLKGEQKPEEAPDLNTLFADLFSV
jgi:hypothetical protein